MNTLRRSSISQLCSRLHTSAARHKRDRPSQKGFSRTRLVQDLKPKEVAGGKHDFVRGGAPHQDAELLKQYKPHRHGRPADKKRLTESDAFRSDVQRPRRQLTDNTPVPPPRAKPFDNLFKKEVKESSTSEFYQPPSPVSLSPSHQDKEGSIFTGMKVKPPKEFTSPPLLPEFLPAISRMLGSDARPTPIQALSIKWLIETSGVDLSQSKWKQFLLASETGSGKSLAYLLPLLQKLKLDEHSGTQTPRANSKHPLNPRAIILAPTHELSRQISSFAKALVHDVKLRVMCASRANTPSTTKTDMTARKMSEQFGDFDLGEMDTKKQKFPVDILVGTPVKLMELIRGRGWDRSEGDLQADENGKLPKLRRGRDKMPGVGKWKAEPALGLQNVEWVVVDEADVLFDPDFQEVTRTLLADISAARGEPVEVEATDSTLASFTPVTLSNNAPEPINYPFNFILTSATIPKNLSSYLDNRHPDLIRLASDRLHFLPKRLKTETVNWTNANKFADIEHEIRKVWSQDAAAYSMVEPGAAPVLSKILIFVNRSSRVDRLAEHLESKGIKCLALTSTSDQRKRGSNKHLDGFLRPVQINPDPERKSSTKSTKVEVDPTHDPKVTPHVLIATSLLSRGLDFSPVMGHVFIADEPRNMVDFLHRAGRCGRAGQQGRVLLFKKRTGGWRPRNALPVMDRM